MVRRIQEGSPTEAITGLAERIPSDLVVIGTHARTGLRKAFLGSVTEDVLLTAGPDVLVVPPPRPPLERRSAGCQPVPDGPGAGHSPQALRMGGYSRQAGRQVRSRTCRRRVAGLTVGHRPSSRPAMTASKDCRLGSQRGRQVVYGGGGAVQGAAARAGDAILLGEAR